MEKERYSYSKLSTFNTCVINYILRYFQHEEDSGNAFSEYGTFIHSIMERWANEEIETWELLDVYKKDYEENVVSSFPRLRNGKTMGDRYYQDGIDFLSNFNGIGDYEILLVEHKFDMEIDDWIFNGIIDLVLQDKTTGEIVVWDWKSKKEFKDKEEEDKYRRQLYLYSEYIKREFGNYPSKTVFYTFRTQREVAQPFEVSALEEAIEWAKTTVKKIRETFNCYDYFFCNNLCGARDMCGYKKVKEKKETG